MNVYLHMGAYYKYGLGEWLLRYKNIERCYIDYHPNYMYEIPPDEIGEGFEYVPIGELKQVDAVDDLKCEKMPALGKDFLQEALKYESMAIHIGYRDTSFPVTAYEETKRKYHIYLRYWNWWFQSRSIDFILFEEPPHKLVSYCLYIVAKIKKIRMLIIAPTGITGQSVYGNDIYEIGADINEAYKKVKDVDVNSIELQGLIKDFYDASLEERKKTSPSDREKGKWADEVYEMEYAGYGKKHPWLYIQIMKIRVLLSTILKYHNIEHYKKYKISARAERRLYQVYLYQKYDSISRDSYDKIAVMPDYSQQYIYFPLQLSPESTSIPLGGVFNEQYTSIQLLARIAEPFGIKIYVKEYYIQPRREISFWEDMRKIPNVELIKTSVGSDDLIKHSIGVANQTGTVILEGVFENKPVFVFGGGQYWKGMPGVFEIFDECQGRRIFQEVLESEYEISKADLKRYFYAVQQNSINYNVDMYEYTMAPDSPEYAATLEELKRLLDRKLEEDSEGIPITGGRNYGGL